MEDECESLSDLDSINSYSSENYTMLQLTYQYGTDMDDAYSDLKSAIDNLMPSLPDECGDPIIMEISADALGTMMISATAPGGHRRGGLSGQRGGPRPGEYRRRGPGRAVRRPG